jgi:hypothetical protein
MTLHPRIAISHSGAPERSASPACFLPNVLSGTGGSLADNPLAAAALAITVCVLSSCSMAADPGGVSHDVRSLAEGSESVVHARVVAFRTTRKTGSSKTSTEVSLEVITTLSGSSRKNVLLAVPAGEASVLTDKVLASAPRFEVGEEIVAFIKRGSGRAWVIAGGYARGFSRVARDVDGKAVLRGGAADGLSLTDLSSLAAGEKNGAGGEAARSSAAGRAFHDTGGLGKLGSGIEGQAMIGPTRPSHRIGDPPDVAPYRTTLVIEAAASKREVARFETGTDGRFSVPLPAGDYVIRGTGTGKMLPRVDPLEVTVLKGQVAHVIVNFDNGMR